MLAFFFFLLVFLGFSFRAFRRGDPQSAEHTSAGSTMSILWLYIHIYIYIIRICVSSKRCDADLADWIGEGAHSFGIGGGKESASWMGEEGARASQENWKLKLNGFAFNKGW